VTTLDHPRYRQDRLIAVGGMGEVWAATDTVLDREVALKVLKKEYADDATFRARFEAEAKHAAALHHPNVAAVMDYGETEAVEASGEPARPYLVMELVRGETLSTLLSGGRALDPRRAAELIAQAATGIHAAHRLGIVHRDVKPGNLMVTPEGTVKVTDFGIARAADAVPLTLTGQVIGTPHYLSPEQAEGKEATPLSDVYSLGVVLYECLVGSRPFTADSPVGVALAHVRDPAPALPDSLPAGLRELVARCLSKDPADRPQSAAELAEALRGNLDATRVSPAAAAGGLDAAAMAGAAATRSLTTTSPAPGPVEEPSGRSGRRRPTALIVGLVVLLLVVLGIIAAVALSGGDDGEPATEQEPEQPAQTEAPASEPAPTPTQQEQPTQDPEPSEPEPEPETVTVDEDDYVGTPRRDAERRLRDLGLRPRVERIDNDGTQEEDTVASVSPTGEVEEGTEITLEVWDKPPPEQGNGPGDGGPPVDVGPGGPGEGGDG
jgi:serine/threonine-protein kinase